MKAAVSPENLINLFKELHGVLFKNLAVFIFSPVSYKAFAYFQTQEVQEAGAYAAHVVCLHRLYSVTFLQIMKRNVGSRYGQSMGLPSGSVRDNEFLNTLKTKTNLHYTECT